MLQLLDGFSPNEFLDESQETIWTACASLSFNLAHISRSLLPFSFRHTVTTNFSTKSTTKYLDIGLQYALKPNSGPDRCIIIPFLHLIVFHWLKIKKCSPKTKNSAIYLPPCQESWLSFRRGILEKYCCYTFPYSESQWCLDLKHTHTHTLQVVLKTCALCFKTYNSSIAVNIVIFQW